MAFLLMTTGWCEGDDGLATQSFIYILGVKNAVPVCRVTALLREGVCFTAQVIILQNTTRYTKQSGVE